MRLAIISDIHANLEALQTALQTIDRAGVDAVYCLGDVVGYNADPVACWRLVREHCDGIVLGNHDAAVAREVDVHALPSDGQAAAKYHRSLLSDDELTALAELPQRITVENCTFVHATPDVPTDWKRLNTYPQAQAQFEHFDTEVCFIGHTHVPAVMADRLGVFQVRPGNRYLINVGSIGQPRDHNPKLSFGLFDTETFEYRNVRLDYDVAAAAQKIQITPQLSNRLAARLHEGV